MIEVLKRENIDIQEAEETLVATYNMGKNDKDAQETKSKIQELGVEKTQLENDLKTFTDQQEAIT